ncbi:MAG: iron-containing alcohol dehydrogenase [Promethearchaeota archaeon]
MSKKREKPAFYELPLVKDMMALLGGRATVGLMSNFFSGRIYSGKLCLIQVSNFLKAAFDQGDGKALIITDAFTKKFVKKVKQYLDLANIQSEVWSGAEPEAPLPTIEDGLKICESFKPNILIAIGGGSVIDTSKILFLKYEKPEMDIYTIIPYLSSLGLRKKIKYFIAIPTTSGTGSEVTPAAVATDTDRIPPKKLEFMHDDLIPDIAILDTYFVKDMPPFLTMATGLDALAHAVGAYISVLGNPIADALNKAAISEILTYLPRACKYGGKDIEARTHMQIAATLAGLGFGNTIAGIDHSLGHSLGKIFGLHHGFSVGLFLPYSVEFQAKITNRWKDLCPLFNVSMENKSREELLGDLIDSIKNFINSIGGATSIRDIEKPIITEEDFNNKLDILANYAYEDGVTLFSYRPIDEKTYKKIFKKAYNGERVNF